MKKLFLLPLLAIAMLFASCEQNVISPEEYENEKLEDIIPEEDNKKEDDANKEEIDYCEVVVKINDINDFYYYDMKIIYEGGSGSGEGTYFIPMGTTFYITYMYYIWQSQSWQNREVKIPVGSLKYLTVSFFEGGWTIEC